MVGSYHASDLGQSGADPQMLSPAPSEPARLTPARMWLREGAAVLAPELLQGRPI